MPGDWIVVFGFFLLGVSGLTIYGLCERHFRTVSIVEMWTSRKSSPRWKSLLSNALLIGFPFIVVFILGLCAGNLAAENYLISAFFTPMLIALCYGWKIGRYAGGYVAPSWAVRTACGVGCLSLLLLVPYAIGLGLISGLGRDGDGILMAYSALCLLIFSFGTLAGYFKGNSSLVEACR